MSMTKVIQRTTLVIAALACVCLSAFDARSQEIGPTSYVFVEAKDSAGVPIPDATVTLSTPERKAFQTEKTTADGTAKLRYISWFTQNVTLQVSKAGYLGAEEILFFYPAEFAYKSYVGRESFPNSKVTPSTEATKIKVMLPGVPLSHAQQESFALADRRRRFIAAAKLGDSAKLKEFLDAGEKPDIVDKDGVTAIAWAAFSGNAEAIKLLVQHGADVRTSKGLANQSLLIYSFEGVTRAQRYDGSVIAEREAIIKLLLKAGAELNARTEYSGTVLNNLIGQTPSIGQPPHSITSALIGFLIDEGADVNAVDSLGQTALMLAADKESVAITRMLLQARAGGSINSRDHQGNSALMHAIRYHRSTAELVNLLIKHGAHVNTGNNEGQTPLMMAARCNCVATASSLIAAKAAVNLKDKEGTTALMYASQGAGAAVSARLVQSGALLEEKDQRGWTALMVASPRYYNDSASGVVKYLISAGANVNAVGNEGETALILAAQHYDELAVAYLIRAGANVNAADRQGQTVLIHACRTDPPIKIKIFIDAGAKATINAKDDKGYTALHYAMSRFYAVDDASQLIAAGANVSEVTAEGLTPLMLAAQSGSAELVKTLLARGARATVNFKDKSGRTALMHVRPRYTYESVDALVQALVDAGGQRNPPK